MRRRPPCSPRSTLLFPSTLLFRSLPLAVMPFHRGRPGRVARRDDASGVGDIAGLHRLDAKLSIKLHRIVELRLVNRDIAAGFMMADQRHALLSRVIGDRLQVEIGIGFGETELVAMAEPIAVPALVPTLDEHAAETVPCREVAKLLRPHGRRAILGPPGPPP